MTINELIQLSYFQEAGDQMPWRISELILLAKYAEVALLALKQNTFIALDKKNQAGYPKWETTNGRRNPSKAFCITKDGNQEVPL